MTHDLEFYGPAAHYYDAAFGWDNLEEAERIAALSGRENGRVLEPMCGPARLLRSFAQLGFEVVGVDRSPEMLDLAAAGVAAVSMAATAAEWVHADVRDFDLDFGCDLAVCPINSVAHLTQADELLAHLRAVSRNLYSGASYWVQADLSPPRPPGDRQSWDIDVDGRPAQFTFSSSGTGDDGLEMWTYHVAEAEGESFSESFPARIWPFDAWAQVIEASPFTHESSYDNDVRERLVVDAGLHEVPLTWHQLVKR